MLLKIKRDLISVFFLFKFISLYNKGYFASCLELIAKIEFLESYISAGIAAMLLRRMGKKYDPDACDPADPFILSVQDRFSKDGQNRFLCSNVIVLKPYVSQKEKGVILLNYTEIINAFPFIFDLHKVQDRYHIVLEPSWESPYQMYYQFYLETSLVFVQSLSTRELEMNKKHDFISIPVCAGDWINENNFSRIEGIPVEYDFCAIANFIPFKRHTYLISALKNHWKGDLKFALIASAHVGEKKAWIEDLIRVNGLEGKVDIYMEIAPRDVNEILNRSKCHVLCSMREGANRANFESMFVGAPVVVHKHHVGFPNWRFSYPMVVNYTSPKTLVDAIKTCASVDRDAVYNKAKQLIGSEIATKTVNDYVKKESLARGDEWTADIFRKVNNVQTYYFNPDDVLACVKDYEFLQEALVKKDCYSAEYAVNKFRVAQHNVNVPK